MSSFSKNIRLSIKALFWTCVFHSATTVLGNTPSIDPSDSPASINAIDRVEMYFKNFETLAKSEKWKEIIVQGKTVFVQEKPVLEFIKTAYRPQDTAKIYAQLTSSAFYSGDYTQALLYANRCSKLSENFIDPSLFLRSLYLKSAVHRALAAKKGEEQAQQVSYLRAVETAEEAALIYTKKNVNNINLQGKIYFNLGAAHADNPKGDLEKAKRCYSTALECFKSTNAIDNCIRINIRLGKVYLLQKKYDLSQQIVDEARSQVSNERFAMHVDYLEAQLKLATNDVENAIKIAENGLTRAEALEAKEDELRLTLLLQTIKNLIYEQ